MFSTTFLKFKMSNLIKLELILNDILNQGE